jgi:hypothetical protein
LCLVADLPTSGSDSYFYKTLYIRQVVSEFTWTPK